MAELDRSFVDSVRFEMYRVLTKYRFRNDSLRGQYGALRVHATTRIPNDTWVAYYLEDSNVLAMDPETFSTLTNSGPAFAYVMTQATASEGIYPIPKSHPLIVEAINQMKELRGLNDPYRPLQDQIATVLGFIDILREAGSVDNLTSDKLNELYEVRGSVQRQLDTMRDVIARGDSALEMFSDVIAAL